MINNFGQTVWVELLKARRSKAPLLTLLGFALVPFVGGFFMIVLKEPEMARRMGIISTKAQMVAGAADWQTYLGILAQATGVGGILLFSFIASWVFGREYSDHTVKDLLALPTSRTTVVLAKFGLIVLWSLLLVGVIYLLGLAVGVAVVLPPTTWAIFTQSTLTIAVTACLIIALVTPIAFFASVGRGYLAPLGVAVLVLLLAQVVAAAGWGDYFPWSIPALRAGMAGEQFTQLSAISYMIVLLTSLLGVVATFVWWERADQPE